MRKNVKPVTKHGRMMQKRSAKHRRLQARTLYMRAANRVVFYFLVMLGCGAVLVTSVPQYRELVVMQSELDDVKKVELEALSRKDKVEREYRALEEDPVFIELKARDVLDYSKPSERIFKIERTEDK